MGIPYYIGYPHSLLESQKGSMDVSKRVHFEITVSQRRRRVANVRLDVNAERTVVDGVAFGNENAVPLALGLLLYAARSFTKDGPVRSAIDCAIEAYDPEVDLGEVIDNPPGYRQPPLDVDDLPF